MVRKIVHIEEELCNGCGACANACHEGAIAMVDGKARLIKDDYCDGLGDCLPACPAGAIQIIEREATDYDEEAVKQRMQERRQTAQTTQDSQAAQNSQTTQNLQAVHTSQTAPISQTTQTVQSTSTSMVPHSNLQQWPVQIKLMPVKAPYYENANLLIAADCTAYAYGNFHQDFMQNHVTVIGCPKLDGVDYSEKLEAIIRENNIKSMKILRMEVPCCGGLEYAAVEALRRSGKMIPWQVVTITCNGRIKEA